MKTRALLAAASIFFFAKAAGALPAVGSATPDASVVDADDKPIELKQLRRKPILVLYEDKDSATMNQALKDELGRLAKGDKYKNAIALVAVADVSSYDFWPIKGFVKESIRKESKKVGTTIYCDWTGSFRKTLTLREGTSSVVLYGRNGKTLFAHEGAVPAAERAKLLALLRREAGGT